MTEKSGKPISTTRDATTPIDLLEGAHLSPELLAYLWLAVDLKMSAIFLGSSSLEKSRYLDALTFLVPEDAKVTSISSGHRMTSLHRHWHNVQLDNLEKVLPHLSGPQAKESDYIFAEKLDGPAIAMAPLLMAQGKSVFSTVDWEEDADNFVQSITSSPPLLHKLHLSAVNIIATVRDSRQLMPEKRAVERPAKPMEKMTLITEVVGYDRDADKLIVNDPYWWERAGSAITRRPYGWFFFSGHSFLYDAACETMKLSYKEMDAEVLRRVDFLRWLFHTKKRKSKEIIDEIEAFRKNPKAVTERCRKELKGVSLPIDGKREDGTPLPRTKARLRAI